MHAILPVLLLLTPALPAAVAPAPAPAPRNKLSAVSVLPDGSQLQGVMFPRFDENHRLVGVLKAKEMTLVDVDHISGETVAVDFFNEDGSPRGRVDMARAMYNQAKGLLDTRNPVTIHSDRLNGKGAGLHYVFDKGQGFLIGPVTTWILNPAATTMNSRPLPLRATAGLGVALLTLPLTAMPPPAVSTAELAANHADAASSTAAAGQAVLLARADLAKDTDDAAGATQAAKGFIAQADLPFADAEPPVPEAKPLEVKPQPNDTVVTCDGGLYFDAENGVLVYLKNVHVVDPRFDLSGANKLQIFLAKKPADPTPTSTKPGAKTGDKPAAKPVPQAGDPPAKPIPADPLGSGLGAKFGEVERLVASGAVRFLQKQPEPGKDPIEASGAIFTYHTNTGQIIISGGYPWVKQGPTYLRAEQPDLNLRILKAGSFVTEGKWTMFGPLKQENKPTTPPKPTTKPKSTSSPRHPN